jgi:hypothetical protein
METVMEVVSLVVLLALEMEVEKRVDREEPSHLNRPGSFLRFACPPLVAYMAKTKSQDRYLWAQQSIHCCHCHSRSHPNRVAADDISLLRACKKLPDAGICSGCFFGRTFPWQRTRMAFSPFPPLKAAAELCRCPFARSFLRMSLQLYPPHR